jgi:hypothetical protein
MKPRTNRISLGSWIAVSHDIFLRGIATDKRMSGPWRAWEIVLSRMNNWGHAAFDAGELAELACGKDTPSNRQMVSRWLKTLGDMKRIMPVSHGGSTQLCVVVNSELAQRGSGRASDYLCAEPGHRGHQKQSWPRNTEDIQADREQAALHNRQTLNLMECAPCKARIEQYGNYDEVMAEHRSALQVV